MIKYRPEVDGLRAVAVMTVILFHGGLSLFSGGFVGVDVFFVISGYLITSIIESDLADGKFSLLKFYERRARRIMPALFLVMSFSLLTALVVLPPADLRDFGRSLVAVNTFTSNILFWREADYFALSTELKPLLHTWSLAVEEQFYLFFPLLLWLLWLRLSKATFLVIILLTGISLILSEWGVKNYPSASFYLLPTRGW